MNYQSQYDGVTDYVKIVKDEETNEYVLLTIYSHRKLYDPYGEICMKVHQCRSISLKDIMELVRENKLLGIEVNGEVIPDAIKLLDVTNRFKNNQIIKSLLHTGVYDDDENNLHLKIIHPIIPDRYK